jgi:hypothetical protein
MVANAARTQESFFISLLLSLLRVEKTCEQSPRSWNCCGTFLKERSARLPIGNNVGAVPTNLGSHSLRAELFVGHPKTTPAFDYFTLRVRRIFCCNFKAIPPVQMGCAKIFRFCCWANHLYQLARLTPPEGRIARRHERGVGCGARGSVGRAGYCRAGLACERSSSAPDERRYSAFIGISAGGTWPAGSVDGGCCVRRSRVVLTSSDYFVRPRTDKTNGNQRLRRDARPKKKACPNEAGPNRP